MPSKYDHQSEGEVIVKGEKELQSYKKEEDKGADNASEAEDKGMVETSKKEIDKEDRVI